MAAAPAAEVIQAFMNPPTDAETLTLFEPASDRAAEINDHIVNHPLAQRLREQANYVETRPFYKIPAAARPHNLTAGPLYGEDKIEVPPLNFVDRNPENPSLVQIMYLGPAVCGHAGIVHGGMVATLLDEGLARACFPALPNKIGVTATLKIDYRAPCPGPGYVVLRAHTTKAEGRKVWVQGWLEELGEEDSTGKKYAEAEALFIEPKNAQYMGQVYGPTAA